MQKIGTSIKTVIDKKKSVADIFIYDEIGQYYDWNTGQMGGVTYDTFNQEFSEAEQNADIINIRISSIGGSVYEGDKIFNRIANSTKEIHTYAVGLCASMAAVLTQAAPVGNRHASKDAKLMFHSAATLLWGYYNASQIRKEADALDIYDSTFSSILSEKLNISEADAKAKLFNGEDNYFTASQSKDEGLIDVIEPYASEIKIDAKTGTEAINSYLHKVAARGASNFSHQSNALDRIVTHIENLFSALPQNANHSTNNKEPMTFEKLKQIASSAKEGLTLGAEDIAALMPEIDAILNKGTLLNDVEVTNKVNLAVEQATAPLNEEIQNLKAQLPAPPVLGSNGNGNDTPPSINTEDLADEIAAKSVGLSVEEYRNKIGKKN